MSDLSCYFDWEGKEILKFAVDTAKSPWLGWVGSFIFFVTKLVFFVQIILSACE